MRDPGPSRSSRRSPHLIPGLQTSSMLGSPRPPRGAVARRRASGTGCGACGFDLAYRALGRRRGSARDHYRVPAWSRLMTCLLRYRPSAYLSAAVTAPRAVPSKSAARRCQIAANSMRVPLAWRCACGAPRGARVSFRRHVPIGFCAFRRATPFGGLVKQSPDAHASRR
jgi:hypothetical protein